MARTNVKAPAKPAIVTHEGGRATPAPNALAQLKRSVLACLLWEDEFYEDGQSIAKRIDEAARQVAILELADLAVAARNQYNLRHVPLRLLVTLINRVSESIRDGVPGDLGNGIVAAAINGTIQRADELTELVALYWKDGKRPLSAQLKKGLARAFQKFDAYQLAKYDRANAVRLRDVLFLSHAKPKDADQSALWKQLVDGTLAPPLTWEVELSAGKDKKETFERLLREGKLGYLALLRNLRNMVTAKVDTMLIKNAILARKGANRVLPFRFVAAAKAAPQFEPELDTALLANLSTMEQLPGRTAVLVDVSSSMDDKLSAKSDLTRMTAAATLASVIPGSQVRVFTFSNDLAEVPPRKGMAGVDAIVRSQEHGGTYLAAAMTKLNEVASYDRLIVVTDEQTHDGIGTPKTGAKAYMINVASAQNGVAYKKPWVHLTGFSEHVIRWILEYERTADA